MAQNEEDRLTADLKQSTPSAWNVVYDRHVGEIFGFVFHLVGGDRMVAQELCQEIWLRSLDHIDQFDPSRGTMRGWLFGIARTQVALYFRRRTARGPTVSVDANDEAVDPRDTSMLPDEALEQIERADAVRAALFLLAGDRRDVLISKYVDGLSVDQIAARTGRSAKAIESLLTRARAEMRGLLQGYFSASTDWERKEPNDGARTGT